MKCPSRAATAMDTGTDTSRTRTNHRSAQRLRTSTAARRSQHLTTQPASMNGTSVPAHRGTAPAGAQAGQSPDQRLEVAISEVTVHGQHGGERAKYPEQRGRVREQVQVGDLPHHRADQVLLPQDPSLLGKRWLP